MARGRREINRAKLSRYDAALLEFAERWARYDGGHEFIFAEFGLTVGEFYRRLRGVMMQLDTCDCDTHFVTAIRHQDAVHNGKP